MREEGRGKGRAEEIGLKCRGGEGGVYFNTDEWSDHIWCEEPLIGLFRSDHCVGFISAAVRLPHAATQGPWATPPYGGKHVGNLICRHQSALDFPPKGAVVLVVWA